LKQVYRICQLCCLEWGGAKESTSTSFCTTNIAAFIKADQLPKGLTTQPISLTGFTSIFLLVGNDS
jgi:hypothetical protein